MAQDYVVARNTSDNGRIAISKSVFQSIAEISVKDIDNTVISSRQPVTIQIDDNKLNISADIKVKYGANVNATASLVQSKIYDNITFMTGMKPAEVTVNVVGFEF